MHKEDLNAHNKVVDSLRKRLEEGNASTRALEAEKRKLASEVGRLKEGLEAVMSEERDEV